MICWLIVCIFWGPENLFPFHLPRPGPGRRRLSVPHGPGETGAGRALGAAGAAAAAARFAGDAGVEAAAGDAVRGLALRLAVAPRLGDLVF